MNEKWDLTPIYEGFDHPDFDKDLKKLEGLIARCNQELTRLAQGNPLDGLKQGVALLEEVNALAGKLVDYTALRQAADTRDSEATSRLGQVLAVASEMASAEASFRSWAAALPNLEELVKSDSTLSEYEFFFKNIRSDSRYLLSGQCEEILAKLQLTGSSAWSDLQQYLTSTVPVTYRGEKLNLSAVRNLAYDADGDVRKDAYEAEIACYDRIKDAVAFSLNSIKLETLNECRLRGYESPLQRTLLDAHMQKKTLDAMFGAIDEFLPVFWKYLKAKARALGQENGLAWWDLFAPMGKSTTTFTTQSARDYLVNLFAGFDKDLSQLVATAFDDAWIDFYPREGKSGGAFCAGINCLQQSRVLTNFSGKLTDVVTLAHELGHAFHNLCIAPHRPLNKEYSMPLAETASTFNECIVMAAAIENATDKEEKLALLESQLQDATQIICDIYSRYRFETAVFENRDEAFLDAEHLCQMMADAQKQCYGAGLDEKTLHPYMWVCKSHYYGASFYNFPYAFGGLFARGLYARYQKEGASFVPKYKKLLYTTTVATAEDTARVVGIDLTDGEFWRSALQTVASQVETLCTLLEDVKGKP